MLDLMKENTIETGDDPFVHNKLEHAQRKISERFLVVPTKLSRKLSSPSMRRRLDPFSVSTVDTMKDQKLLDHVYRDSEYRKLRVAEEGK